MAEGPDGVAWKPPRLHYPVAGVIRLRNVTAETSGYAIGNDTVIEVLKDDGTWMLVRGVCSAVLTIKAQEIVTADLRVEVAGFDFTAFPLQIKRPSWWRRLIDRLLRYERWPS